MAELRKGIPEGKTRVIGVDPFSNEDYLVKDCDTREEAFQLADTHNKARESDMDNVRYVYDDAGRYLRGNEAVSSLGVSP